MDLLTVLFLVAMLASLPAGVLLAGILTERARADSWLLRRSRLVAGLGVSVWGALLVASLALKSPLYQAVGSALGMLLAVFLAIAQSKLQSPSDASL